MSKGKILATIVTLISSTSLCLAGGTCPSQSVIDGDHIKELATTGETEIGAATYWLVPEKKTGNNYNKKLLDTKKHLEGFIKVSGISLSNLNKDTARVVSIRQEPGKNFCAYNITVGTNNAVIALESAPVTTYSCLATADRTDVKTNKLDVWTKNYPEEADSEEKAIRKASTDYQWDLDQYNGNANLRVILRTIECKKKDS